MRALVGAACASLALCLIPGGPALADAASAQAEADKAYQSAQSALNAHAWGEAELYFERVLMFNPEHAEARVQLALLLAQQGKPEAASGFIQSLIDDPRTLSAHRVRLLELLAQLRLRPPPSPSVRASPLPDTASPTSVIASPSSDSGQAKARQSMSPSIAPLIQARVSLAYSSNPYARADINSLTLTLPGGSADLPVNQHIAAAPLLMSSLSYMAPNLCGYEAYDQHSGGSESNSADKVLLFCYGTLGGEKIQTFASSFHSVDGTNRVSAGFAWPVAPWRLTAQVFKEPQLERQGYSVRVDRLLAGSMGAQTLLYGELEKATTGVPGYLRAGFIREYALTPEWSLLTQFSLQRDLAGYSALLENSATRKLAFAEIGLQKDWGTFAGWRVNSALRSARRWSNLALFEFKDTTLQLSFDRPL